MKFRPIIFSAPMMRALLDGTKTQARRIIKPQPETDTPGVYCDLYDHGPDWAWWLPDDRMVSPRTFRCPFGIPGDGLWVREAWACYAQYDHVPPRGLADNWPIRYRAGGQRYGDHIIGTLTAKGAGRWRSPFHMPRWASRLSRTLADVRPERVQDITEADAIAEGATKRDAITGYRATGSGWSMDWSRADICDPRVKRPLTEGDICLGSARMAFANYWDSLNATPKPVRRKGKITHYESYPWDTVRDTREHRGLPWEVCGNPWVWALDLGAPNV